ncbi:tail-anchored protein insertion receptor WRB isoform X1 [Dendrobium catenatum]|uniref:tail-anchored protein insertion receptor WRB isoform X1 n=1 Tax=Dendrobium catenatum TaxID=906689 RepID=UPI00109F982A|nr:tail-anchored protein insertion receptor WRB isoform X1 [Dendrobium catenatum]
MTAEMDETLGEVRRPLSPFTILLIVVALQFLDVLLEKLKKRGSTSSEEIKMRQEINQLLQEANSLSTPSTFAQAAKLRRSAVAKEKELKKKQEEKNNDKKWSLYEKVLLVSKALLYTGLCWQFWSTPVAAVPPHLLQPFGRFLSWRGADASNGNYMVGIIPWLVLTSRVSKFLLQRFSKFIPF